MLIASFLGFVAALIGATIIGGIFAGGVGTDGFVGRDLFGDGAGHGERSDPRGLIRACRWFSPQRIVGRPIGILVREYDSTVLETRWTSIQIRDGGLAGSLVGRRASGLCDPAIEGNGVGNRVDG